MEPFNRSFVGIKMQSTLVIGFGNTLRGDDGMGILAIRALRAMGNYGPHVSFLEMEAAMINVLDHLEGIDRLLIVDTIALPGVPPGQIRRMSLDELDHAKSQAVSTHQFGLTRVLNLAESLGYTQRRSVTICALAIEPPTDFSEHLSAMAMNLIPDFLHLISSTIHETTKGEPAHGND